MTSYWAVQFRSVLGGWAVCQDLTDSVLKADGCATDIASFFFTEEDARASMREWKEQTGDPDNYRVVEVVFALREAML